LNADVIVGADGSHGICRAILLPQDPPKPTGLTLFKYVLPPPFFLRVYVLTGFLIMKIISSVIPADRVYADPELRSLVDQEQVIITYRSVTVDLILSHRRFHSGHGLGTIEHRFASPSYVMTLSNRITISTTLQGPARDLAWYFFVRDDGAKEGWNDILTPEQFAPYVSNSEPR